MPRATYRVQLTPQFGFAALRAAIPYLHRLGISHLYLSPIFQSRPGSQHGYDVIDHSQVDEELGGRAGLDAVVAFGREHGMGILLDIVPNHMAVLGTDNAWWQDVLGNGPASRHAHYFDIDWMPTRRSMHNRLLMPILGSPLGDVIDRGEIRVGFRPEAGSFTIHYFDFVLPVEPRSVPLIFRDAAGNDAAQALEDEAVQQEFASLMDSFAVLPPPVQAGAEVLAIRDRDRQVNQRRLSRLCMREPAVTTLIDAVLRRLNAPAAEELARLLQAQPYRLAFWRVSGEEINYRRFFDVNELAALRVEDAEVFAESHALVRQLWDEGVIDGVRVDHADGLYDPTEYFQRLQAALPSRGEQRPWMLVEKILAAGEKLPADWCVDGTTGYEFGALVTAWLSQPAGVDMLDRTWRRHTGSALPYAEIVYRSKQQVMRTSLAAEVSMLAARLDRLAQMHRNTSDFTLFDLREAIVEVIACFPVYRTYFAPGRTTTEDSQLLRRALGAALSRKHSAARALEFLGSVLLGELAQDASRANAAMTFTQKFQQVTSPVMAKGVEDTAFYRYARFLAVNEVGGDPDTRGLTTEGLHRANEQRARDWPRAMLSTSTHDTKRGEDARYRLCVLSELPQLWSDCVSRWRRLKRHRRVGDASGAAQEYLLLQSLLGIWPVSGDMASQVESLRTRLGDFAIKAAREAKEATSWLDPDAEVEKALQDLVAEMLPAGGGAGFEHYFRGVIERVPFFGLLNALSATVLKLTAPGIPDLYQGTELPALTLVDPDNRQVVDFATHDAMLQAIEQSIAAQGPQSVASTLLAHWQDGRIKMLVSSRLLQLRARQPGAFGGAYVPIPIEGQHAEHLCAFARVAGDEVTISVACRWAATLAAGALRAPTGEETWEDTLLNLPRDVPRGTYADVLSGATFALEAPGDAPRTMRAGQLLATLPCCVLTRRSDGP